MFGSVIFWTVIWRGMSNLYGIVPKLLIWIIIIIFDNTQHCWRHITHPCGQPAFPISVSFIKYKKKKNHGTLKLLNCIVVCQRKSLRSSDPHNSYYRYFWFHWAYTWPFQFLPRINRMCENACENLGQRRNTKSENWQMYYVCTVYNNTSDAIQGELAFPPAY